MKQHQKTGIALAAIGGVILASDWAELTLRNSTGTVAALILLTIAIFFTGVVMALHKEDF